MQIFFAEVAWICNINKLDYSSCKTFLYLFKSVIEFLSEKNINFIKQNIEKNSLHLFPSSSHVDIDNNTCIISTHLSNFVQEMVNALGINTI